MQSSNQKIGILNSQLFNKKETIIVADNTSDAIFSDRVSEKVLAAMLANFEFLGYQFEKEDILKMAKMSEQTLLEQVYDPVLAAVKEARGEDVQHNLLFPNFPETVRNLDIETLSYMRFVSYFTTFYDEYIIEESPFAKGTLTSHVQQMLLDMNDDIKRVKEAQERQDNVSRQSDEVSPRKESNSPKQEKTNESDLRTIHLGTMDDYYHMLSNMLSSKTSLSAYDKEIIGWALDNLDRTKFMPDKIPFKENWALVVAHDFATKQYQNIDIKSVQDFERLLAVLTRQKVTEQKLSQVQIAQKKLYGDITLSKKQHFANFTNQERRALISIFTNALKNNYPIMLESAINRESKTFTENVLVKRLHFDQMDKANLFDPFVEKADKTRSAMSYYEQSLQNGEYDRAAQQAAEISPGVLGRKIKMLVSKAEAFQSETIAEQMIEKFRTDGKDIPMDILLSLRKEVQQNTSAEEEPIKFYFAKSSEVAIKPFENKALKMSENIQHRFEQAIDEIIDNQLKTLGDMGKVYIDPELTNCPIPLVGRSDGGKNRTIATGTSLGLDEGTEVLRAALYKKGSPEEFIDFSCAFLDENYKFVGQVSWNNLKEGNFAYHSGDCSHISQGVTEVIDVDLDKMKQAIPNAKYIVYQALAYSHRHTMNQLDKVFLTLSNVKTLSDGLDEHRRNDNGVASELFNPSEQKFKLDITGDTFTNIPLLYDIEQNRVSVLNLATRNRAGVQAFGHQGPADNQRHFDLPENAMAIENYAGALALTTYYITQQLLNDKTSIYDLAMMNVNARHGILVDNKEDADIIFAMDREPVKDEQKLVTIFDKDVLTTEYMVSSMTETPDKKEKAVEKEQITRNDNVERG